MSEEAPVVEQETVPVPTEVHEQPQATEEPINQETNDSVPTDAPQLSYAPETETAPVVADEEDEPGPVIEQKHRKKDTKPLTADIISKGISLLARTGNGLSHAYTKLEIHALGITGIDILEAYTHLRYIV